ncbi:hypothetical protein B566_EDAN011481 [Ephemera danica]|nr:hypothetical protein B566_EDAN011481 [Ephemera danica]
MEAVRNRQADAVTLDVLDAYKASRFFNIHAVMSENVTGSDAEYYTVAVAKRATNKLIAPVSNTVPPESCHQDVTDSSVWKVPKAFLLQEGVLGAQHDCPLGVSTAGFTWQNCASGAADSNPCPSSDSGDNVGEKGALRCFVSGRSGDVAFLKASTFAKFADGASSEGWAAGLKSEDYKLLCPDACPK